MLKLKGGSEVRLMTAEKRDAIGGFADKFRERIESELEDINTTENLYKAVEILGGRIEASELSKEHRYEEVVKSGDDEFIIRIDLGYGEQQQRFTIAHELGHLFLHMRFGTEKWYNEVKLGDNYNRVMGLYSAVEGEANEFADVLLMPKAKFEKAASENTNSVDKIAIHFNVPNSAVVRRGRSLGLWM
jgi:Zn-dependent peptidase ImmA (M78 family)